MARNSFVQARVDAEMAEALKTFCERTNRDQAATVRAIIGLFFADGAEMAEARLDYGLWDLGERQLRAMAAAYKAVAEAREVAEELKRSRSKGRRRA